MKIIKIGYFADGPWSHEALKLILRDPAMDVRFICARWENPDPVLKEMADRYRIEFFVEKNVNSEVFLGQLRSKSCDIFVSMSFNQIFRKGFFSLPSLGTINCHAGKLPYYKGRNILNWALINDEKEFGITVHYVDEGIDTGDIIYQESFEITDADDYNSLLNRAHTGCGEVLYKALVGIRDNKLSRLPQSSLKTLGFYCTQRKAGDERLVWTHGSREIFNFVRAICAPGPKARTMFGTREISINKVEYISDAIIYKGIPGAVIGIEDSSFLVKTGDSYVKVVEWDTGYRPRIGDRFE